MYQSLVPCPSCKRHVRAAEAACPFCSSALPEGIAASVIPSATKRLSRAAAFVFGATIAVTTGCGTDTDGGGSGGGDKTTSSSTGPEDDGGVMALYGVPAPDGGPDDDGGAQAEYGAPVPEDAGTDAG